MDIVIATVKGRERLLEQTIRSSIDNESLSHTRRVQLDHALGLGVGGAKNVGAAMLRDRTSDYLMFLDDDMYLLPEWDRCLINALTLSRVDQLGGWSHPYNKVCCGAKYGPPDFKTEVGVVDAVAGGCQVMRWETWDKYGPFDNTGRGPGQSEDFALSRKILDAGGRIGCIVPFVAIHCGLTNTRGEKAVGWREMEELARRQMLENKINPSKVVME